MSKTTPDHLQKQTSVEAVELFAPDAAVAETMQVLSATTKTMPLSLFVKAVEQAPIAISITDKKANILYINEAFTEVTGYSAQEILGENESKLSDKSTPRQVYYELWHTISRKQIWQGELVNRRKHGQRYLASLTVAPMLDEHGDISHFIGMHRDVTQAHYAEQQVSNQKQLIESVINASPIAMAVLDREHRILLDNEMYKMLISELGQPEPALFFLEALQQNMGEIWRNGGVLPSSFSNFEVRVEGTSRRRTRWFSCSGNWFKEDDTRADSFFSKQTRDYLLLSINDITLQRSQQEKLQLQTLRSMMAEEEHIRSIRETLLGAMHQIRLPLNQIDAAVQLMIQRNDIQHQPLKELLCQVQKMGEETLTTLQRCVPEIPESAVIPINLNQLLHEVIRLYSHKLLANGVVIDWLPNPVLPSILGSENKLRMMFKQLIDNAVNAMNRASSKERLIKFGTAVEYDRVCVTVADSGPGIPANQRSKVFEPFFTIQGTSGAQASGVQAGMGLVMVKEIITQHNGMIEIDPDYSNGCSFNISFPCQYSSSKVSIND